jgi:anti-sigma factor RsiW
MSHVDEGTLHALLDGELAPAEVVEVQTHFATCPACSARLDSARKLLAETERLVSALEPSAAVGERVAPRPIQPPFDPPVAIPVAARLHPAESAVLIPNNPTAAEVRRSRLKVLGWAAGVLVVVGAGVFGVQMQMGMYDKKPAGMLRIRPEEFSTPITVTDSVAAARAAVAARAQPSGSPAQGAATPAPASGLGTAPTAQPGKAPTPAPPSKAQPAREQPSPTNAKAPDRNRPAPDSGGDGSAGDRDAIAARAAKATQALDRERNEQRAAAATASLDSARRAAQLQAQQQAAAAPYAPVVPTLDQRAQVANRIGLDEASRQLGGPLHAIDGMSRQLVGVVSPQLVPGTDTSRAVVRAVYVDRGGRLIFLDQQRVRAGQADLPSTPQARRNGELRWMAGQVLIVLQGDLPTDSLRFIARHVR